MPNTTDECPVCHSKNLEQEFHHPTVHSPMVIGGEVTSSPAALDGCSCNNCGTRLKFNKKGPCPSCEGTGKYSYVTSRCGIQTSTRTTRCPTCEGTGVIV